MRHKKRRQIASTPAWLMAAAVIAAAFVALPGDAGLSNSARAQSHAPATAPASDAALRNAGRLMASRLVNHAYDRTRDTATATSRIAQEVAILLQEASRLEPDNLHTLKLLAEAARNSPGGSPDIRRDALRKIIRLDPGDMVAQVQYLDLVAGASQALDERARVYQAALDSTKLDPQIRSQMAVRLAHIAVERDEMTAARTFLRQAVTFNDVNVDALRELARLSARDPREHLKSLLALLTANPYQPDAWIGAAGVLGSAGVHDRAADFLNIAIEQMYHETGQPGDGGLYLQFALELAASGRSGEAYPILRSLSSLPDAPLSALMAAALLSAEYNSATLIKRPASTSPATAPAEAPAPADDSAATAPAAPPEEPLAVRLVKRLSQSIAANPKSAPTLAEAVWIELSALPEVADETKTWLRDYAAMVPADDATLAHLRGWQLLRDGKFAEAQAALEKYAAADPLARLGLAKALLQQKKMADAAKELQDIWSSHPTGLFAFQVAQTARLAHINLTATTLSTELLETLRSLPSRAMVAHRDPRDRELISVTIPKRDFDLGEPVMLTIRLTNTSDQAVPVGPDGVIKTNVGITAGTRGLNQQVLGMYVVEDLQRVYRLERRGVIEAAVRADVGALGDLCQMNPLQEINVGLSALTAPRGSPGRAVPGLGGEQVDVGEFQREGVVLKSDVVLKLVQQAAGLPLDKQMIRGELMAALVGAIPDLSGPGQTPEETKSREATTVLRISAINVIQDDVKSPSPLLRAWMLQVIPSAGINEDIRNTVDAMGSDPDPLVRIMWTIRQVFLAHDANSIREAVLVRLEKMAAAEKDPTVKQWMTMLAQDERTRPAPKPQPPADIPPAK